MSALRIRHRYEEIEAYFNRTLLPSSTDLSLRARHPKILGGYRHHVFPQWIVNLRSSHSKKVLIRWILSKLILGYTLSRGEELIFLGSVESDMSADVFVHFLQKKRKTGSKDGSQPLLPMIEETLPLLIQCSRILAGYTPSVIYLKDWRPVKLPPKKVIGLGYTDHGTLGSGPSWKEQILEEEEVTYMAEDDFVIWCQSLMEYSVPTILLERSQTPLKRPRKGRKG